MDLLQGLVGHRHLIEVGRCGSVDVSRSLVGMGTTPKVHHSLGKCTPLSDASLTYLLHDWPRIKTARIFTSTAPRTGMHIQTRYEQTPLSYTPCDSPQS